MSTTVSGSNNIAVLDSLIIADLCTGKFYIDLTPSEWIDSGAENVLGAKVQITSPAGVIVKAYNGYDISPAYSGGMDAPDEFSIPTQAGNYQYGKYTIDVTLYDADGTTYIISKTVNICEPDPKNKTRKYGTLGVTIKGVCKDGKVYITTNSIPTYRGKAVEDSTTALTVEYPTGSGLDVLSTTLRTFSVQLFEGEYLVEGTVCATYNFGDNVYVKVNYKVKVRKSIKCIIDECCVSQQLSSLQLKLNSGCSIAEKEDTLNKIVDALRYLKMAQLVADCGDDPSDYINLLEDTLGCVCTCECNEGVPIINTAPAKDFVITGCNVTKETSGLTDSYIIENYEYVVAVDNGGIITVTSPTLDDCTKTQTVSFNIGNAYAAIKNRVNSFTEFNWWASIINYPLNQLNALCLGYTTSQWAALSFVQKIGAIITQACSGGDCDAEVLSAAVEQVGSAAHIEWEQTDAYTVDVFVDGILRGTVLGTVSEFTVEDVADGESHDYELVPRCTNGSVGTPKTGTFGFLNCPSIGAPNVSSNNVNGADCPYDLTSLVSAPMSGIFHEWHTANNTNASSLVPDPTGVSSGVYYVFAFDTDGCYSVANQVTVICAAATSCTAPQTLTALAGVGGTRVSFQSAAYPPPANSYTVKRKPGASPDVDGSYTTIGTPTWNATTNRWEIVDATAVQNTLYTYKAISNCADASRPATSYNYANLTCPTLTLTPGTDDMDYSFTGVGGEVDKYEVTLYEGAAPVHTDTHVPAFATPITGTIIYLEPGVVYRGRIRVFIGTVYKDCDFVTAEATDASGDGALSAFLSKSGVYSGNLTLSRFGGTGPFSYIITATAMGPCEDSTIDDPTGAIVDEVVTGYAAVAYAGTTYQFTAQITDSLGAVALSNTVTIGACLDPRTMIAMNNGTREREIGSLAVGDKLLGDGFNEVLSVSRIEVDTLYVITAGVHTLKASEGHIHIVRTLEEDSLVQSKDLEVGDRLIDRYNEPVEITGIEVLTQGKFEVINISTTTKRYVASGVITHNKIACP